MKKVIFILVSTLSSLLAHAQEEDRFSVKGMGAKTMAEFKRVFQQKVDEADFVIEGEFTKDRETHLTDDEKNITLENKREYPVTMSMYIKVDAVYKQPNTKAFKAGYSIAVSLSHPWFDYKSTSTEIQYGYYRTDHGYMTDDMTGRYIIFGKLKTNDAKYRVKHKNILSVELQERIRTAGIEYEKRKFLTTYNQVPYTTNDSDFVVKILYRGNGFYYKDYQYYHDCYIGNCFTPMYFGGIIGPGHKAYRFITQTDFESFLTSIKRIKKVIDPNYKTYAQLEQEQLVKDKLQMIDTVNLYNTNQK